MSHRHVSRADHDARLHEPSRQHLLQPHPAHAPGHGPHLNGNGGLPATPGTLSNGSSHGVSPAAMPSGSVNGSGAAAGQPIISQLARENEKTWLTIGRVAEQMEDLEHALSAYENALRHNPNSLPGLTQVAHIARIKENYPKAIEYFDRAITLQEDNGELWSALGHCFLMQDDLQKAYNAYQQALYLLPNPKEDPKLWYGIGILYDRYGSLEHAEEAFASVLRMEKAKELDFDKSNEILFRLGIIYKQQQKYAESLAAFERILRSPPNPLAHADIYFQIGHVYEQQKDYVNAKQAYEQVVAENPNHAKVLQQLGWLYHQDGSTFQNQETAIQYLTKSLEADPSDPQSWYLLGRAYMAGQKYNKAYEAYQQAVYRDGRNPTFWCSIGVLYFQINQLRDALDAYSRAIRINPYISEVWYDLGSLYESCNNQISDAIDAYARASELDPTNKVITQRLELLRNAQATGSQLPAAPGPQDVHPTAYANAVVPPNGLSGPPLLLASAGSTTRPSFRNDSRDVDNGAPLSHASLNGRASPPPRYRAAPPPINVDDSRRVSTHPPLAPMEVDRPASHREGSMRMHVHHSPISPHEAPRGMAADPYMQRPLKRQASMSASPQMQGVHELISAPSPKQYPRYSSGRRSPVSTTPSMHHHHRRSSPPPPPRGYQELASNRDMAWERPSERHHPMEEDGRRGGGAHETSLPPPPPLNQRSRDVSPVSSHGGGRASAAQWSPYGPGAPQPLHHERSSRYDPLHDGAPGGGYSSHRSQHRDRSSDSRHGSYARSPEVVPRHVLPSLSAHGRGMSPGPQERVHPSRRSTGQQHKDNVMVPSMPSPAPVSSKPSKPSSSSSSSFRGEPPASSSNGRQTPKAPPALNAPPLKVSDIAPGSSSSRSHSHRPQSATQPSPVHPRPPVRVVDEDYDDGVAEVLMDLAARPVRSPPDDVLPPPPSASASKPESPVRSMDSPSRYTRGSVSSNGSRHSPQGIKRPRSPASDSTTDSKRSRIDRDVIMRSATSPEPTSAAPSSGGGRPGPSSRPSPIPFRTQPSANSLSPPQSKTPVPPPPPPPTSQAMQPSLPSVLPPHPRPVGNAGSNSSSSNGNNSSTSSSSTSSNNVMALPPIATLPASPDPSDDRGHLDNRMHIDEHISDSRDSRNGNSNNSGESGLRSRSASGSHSRRPSITYSPRDRDRNGPASSDRERERERSSIMSPRERERPNGASASVAAIQRSQSRPSSGPGTPQTMVMSTPSPGGSSNNGGNGGQTLPKVEASA